MPNLVYPGEAQPPVNVLAARYASPEMVANFSDEAKVYMERGLWIEIMRAQASLGVDISDEVIADYEAVQGDINLDSIRERERVSHHDVNSRINEFNDLAGHQRIHLGMTSRDITENTEQFQILNGMNLIQLRVAATLGRFASNALRYETLPMAGRSHNVAGQTILLGKRFSNYGEELLGGYDRLVALRQGYALRGIKGPMGTQQDMLEFLGGDPDKVDRFEAQIAEILGFSGVLNSVGQVYPRSMDFDVITALKQVTAGPTNYANTVRLMAGQELATEGFAPGQVGSNAMPHKMNAAKSERIAALSAILTGHVASAAELSSRQWNEGDVSCSAVRRAIIPDAFFATDGILQTTMKILDKFGAYPAMVDKELTRYLPFMISGELMRICVENGMGREDAHEKIKEHAVKAALRMREQGAENDLLTRIADDVTIPVDWPTLNIIMGSPFDLTGMAHTQIGKFLGRVQAVMTDNPEAETYIPAEVV